jgi:hypothetical protein
MNLDQELNSIIEKIRSSEKELSEINDKLQNQNFLSKVFFNGVSKSRKEHLILLIDNYRVSLELKIEQYLKNHDIRFKKLVEENMALVSTDKFELKFFQKHKNIEQALTDLSDLPQYYQPMSAKFNGHLKENGFIEYNASKDKTGEYGQVLSGFPTTFSGKINFKGSSYLLVTETVVKMAVRPHKYIGSINEMGEIILAATPDTTLIAGALFIPNTLTSSLFEPGSSKAIQFFHNKTEAEKIFEDSKKQMGLIH